MLLIEIDEILRKCILDYNTSSTIKKNFPITPLRQLASKHAKCCETKISSIKETNDSENLLDAGRFESYPLHDTLVFWNQRSKLLAKFMFKISN